MSKFLTKKEAEKIYKLLLISLPENVDIGYEKDLMHRSYIFTAQRTRGSRTYQCGFEITSKKIFQENSWYLIKKMKAFFEKWLKGD